jgi:hypothetical protein
MSAHPCHHGRGRLEANATCGARCPEFPSCLPSPSPEVATAVLRLHLDRQRAHVHAVTATEALQVLHEAITEGLHRKELPPWTP